MRLKFLPQNFRTVISLALVLLISHNTNAQIITTFAGNGTPGWSGDGTPATSAAIKGPNAVMVDGSGNVFICDANNNRVRMISPSGIISEIAGNGTPGFFGDGGPATAAEFNDPTALAMDVFGNLYVADLYNQVVRKISPAIGGTITTISGTPLTIGYFGDGGSALSAKFHNPYGLSFDSYGDLYIVDQYNHAIRKITMSTGIITTFAGTGVSGFSGEGKPATVAQLSYPNCVYVDGYDNVFISDNGNQRIRKVNTVDTIYTIAGNGTIGFFGDTGPATNAELNYQAGMKVDALGNLYICDQGNNRIRKVSSAGIINTIAGNGTPGYLDGVAATSGEINSPLDIAIDHSGNILIADYNNNRIREIPSGNHPPAFTNGHNQAITICENSGAGAINSLLAITDPDAGQTETWTLHSGPFNGTAFVSYTATSTGGVLTPAGLYYMPAIGYSGLDSFKVWVNDGSSVDSTKVVVTINPTPTAITGAMGLCTGSTTTLSDGTTGGTWSSQNTSVATIDATSGFVTSTSAGIDTISYSNTCGSATYSITVSNVPDAGTITGAGSVCAGSSIPLSDAATGGVWSASNTDAIVSGGIVTGMVAGTDTIGYAVTNSCSTAIATAVVTVNLLPNAGVITGSGSVCVGATTSLSDAATGGAWNTANLDASVSGGVVTGISVGIDTISYFVSNVCGNAFATHTLTVLAMPDAGAISGFSTVCVGANITLADPADGGAGIWNSSNANAGVVAGVVTGMTAGTSIISYNVSNTCGTATATFVVTMSSFVPVTGPITGPVSAFCAGTSATLSEPTTGGSWSSSNKTAYVSGGVVTGVSGGADTISYSITNGCGSASSVYVVTINPLPDAGNVLGLDNACPGYTVTLADGVGGGTWSSSDNGIATVTNGVVRGVSAGTAFIIYTTTNACGTSSVKYPFTVLGPSDCVVYTGVTTPSGLPEGEEALSVYPNPNGGEFTVNLLSDVDEHVGVVVMNMVGQKVKEFTIMSNKPVAVQLDVPAGVYFISVSTASGRYVQKVVVDK